MAITDIRHSEIKYPVTSLIKKYMGPAGVLLFEPLPLEQRAMDMTSGASGAEPRLNSYRSAAMHISVNISLDA